MQKRPLVIAVYEPRWFLKVLAVLRERNVSFSHYYSRDEVPYGSVFYTDYTVFLEEVSDRRDVVVFYDPSRDCRVLEKAILATRLKTGYRELVLGVDPGRRLGYIVIGDGEYVEHGTGDYIDVVNMANYLRECMPADRVIVRVGSRHRGVELASMLRRDTGLRVEIVDEDATTPGSVSIDEARVLGERLRRVKPFREKDVYAAFKIAMMKGVEVE
ncbi:hypothetical protein [Desulfurococcus mucosus]|uniref:Uncharacterized protein n=1 Tax=Desulfurococcus mucosus (strain ATCC 35584 / DSM 2162 / JCM 9187 / O7/1) TaxID=765177 RepID=E8R928_DESM0|nr:hypothetical protein [Desulfurococcus mucosus]ADV65004.1 hypothetical protein Desmu_0697 [Desulfurococcus mucosus DSM 2162]